MCTYPREDMNSTSQTAWKCFCDREVCSQGVPGQEPSPLNRSWTEFVLCSFTSFFEVQNSRNAIGRIDLTNEYGFCLSKKNWSSRAVQRPVPLARALSNTTFSFFDVFRFWSISTCAQRQAQFILRIINIFLPLVWVISERFSFGWHNDFLSLMTDPPRYWQKFNVSWQFLAETVPFGIDRLV